MDNRLFRASSWAITIGIFNFFLFAAVSIVIGGDALNGGLENGQYYLGGGGHHTPVPYLVFLFSQVHAYSVLVSWPAIIVLSLVSWATWPQESGIVFGLNPEEPAPAGGMSLLLFRARNVVWRSVDLLEEAAWLLLDSWRRPDVEVFARHTVPECIANLRTRVNLTGESSGPAVFAYLTGRHFQLMRTPKRFALLIYRGPFPVLAGKIIPTDQGTFVRAWHRFPSTSILITGFLLGAVAALLGTTAVVHLFSVQLPLDAPSQSWVILSALLVLTVAMGASLSSLVIGAWIGKRLDEDLRVLVYLTLQGSERSTGPTWRTGPA
jgi:hypothetical protein